MTSPDTSTSTFTDGMIQVNTGYQKWCQEYNPDIISTTSNYEIELLKDVKIRCFLPIRSSPTSQPAYKLTEIQQKAVQGDLIIGNEYWVEERLFYNDDSLDPTQPIENRRYPRPSENQFEKFKDIDTSKDNVSLFSRLYDIKHYKCVYEGPIPYFSNNIFFHNVIIIDNIINNDDDDDYDANGEYQFDEHINIRKELIQGDYFIVEYFYEENICTLK